MKKGVLYTFGASIILIICFIAFVLPSSLSRTAQQEEGLVFGKYNGKKISYEYGSDFTNFLSQYAQLYRNQGIEISSSNQYTIYNYAFNSTVVKYAQEAALKKAGYEVPQSSINNQLKNYFKDSDGKISVKTYKQTDSSYLKSLTDSIKQSLYTGRYYDDYYGSTDTFGGKKLFGLKSTESEINFIKNFGKEKRAFNMVVFNTSNYPEDEQVKFGKANSDKFVKYDLSVITVEKKEIAEKIISRIEKGQITFDDAITEYSDKNYSNSEGKLSNTSKYQIENILKNKEDLEKIQALSKDEISTVFETLIGYSIFRNDGSTTQPDFSTEETLKDVKNYISTYETSIIEDYFADIAKNFVKDAKAGDLETTVANYENAELHQLAAFPLNYGSSPLFEAMDTNTLTVLATADKNEDFLKKAFSLKLNEYSEPIIMGGDIVVIQYTGSEDAEASEDAEDTEDTEETEATEETPVDYDSQLAEFDQNTSQTVIFQSPKFENNFISVYIENFMSSSY